MAISYQLAELVQKITGDVAARKENLLRARDFYDRFLKLLDSYDVLGKSDSKLYETYLEDRNSFSTASTKDVAARRDAKIARSREEKELKKKLEVSLRFFFLVLAWILYIRNLCFLSVPANTLCHEC